MGVDLHLVSSLPGPVHPLYTSNTTQTCVTYKNPLTIAFVGCIKNGQEEEYRSLIGDFVAWCRSNSLQLNTTKTKEMVVDFRRKTPPAAGVY